MNDSDYLSMTMMLTMGREKERTGCSITTRRRRSLLLMPCFVRSNIREALKEKERVSSE